MQSIARYHDIFDSGEEWREAYTKRVLREQEIFDAGVEIGESQKEIKIAVKMIKRGDSIEDIVELTDLPVDTIEDLKEKCKKKLKLLLTK